MNTLILYATKHGTVAKCAEKLSKNLTGNVDMRNIKIGVIPDISKYDKIIIGASVYVGKIQKEISEFCVNNLNRLMEKKVGIFICCLMDDNIELNLKTNFPKELLNSAVSKECFGGELRFSDMSFMEKTMTKMVMKAEAKKKPGKAPLDMNKDNSMLEEKKINEFAQLMNNA